MLTIDSRVDPADAHLLVAFWAGLSRQLQLLRETGCKGEDISFPGKLADLIRISGVYCGPHLQFAEFSGHARAKACEYPVNFKARICTNRGALPIIVHQGSEAFCSGVEVRSKRDDW
jgi:hypothetical protein